MDRRNDHIVHQSVYVEIPEEKSKDLLELTDEIESSNVVSVRKLRKYAEKANSLRSLVDVMRPFVCDTYGAIMSADCSDAVSHAPQAACGRHRSCCLQCG